MRLWQRLGLRPPPEITRRDQLAPGRVRATGRISCAAALRAPITGIRCAAFLYHASCQSVRARGIGNTRSLFGAMVYADPLALELEGCAVLLRPRRCDTFVPDGHRALAARDLPGFRAKEIVMMPGERVRADGRLRRRDNGWTLHFHQLIRLDAP